MDEKTDNNSTSSTEYIQQELPFDPIAVENLRQSIIQYDLMLLKYPHLKQHVEKVLYDYKNNIPH